MTSQTVTASEFKATCLEIFDRLAAHEIDRLVVTKRGRPVAVLTPPPTSAEAVSRLFGFAKDTTHIPDDLDLVESGVDARFEAEDGWPG